METIYSPYAIFRWYDGARVEPPSLINMLAWPLGTSLEKAEDYPLNLQSHLRGDKTKVLVTCGTQLPLGEEIC